MDSGRRSILRWGALAVGTLAGAVGIGAVAEKSAAALTGKTGGPAGATVIKLHGSQWHLQAPDLRRGVPPRPGDRVSISGVLHATPGGPSVGQFFATSIHLDTPDATTYASAEMQMQTIHLADGTIMGMGTATGARSAFAVVGGTGRYSGATGSYVATQSPAEVGGDGTAELTLTLKLVEEAH